MAVLLGCQRRQTEEQSFSGATSSEQLYVDFHTIVGPSIEASQRDLFGRAILEQPDYEVTSKGSVVTVRMTGISSLLLNCRGELRNERGTVPFRTAALVQFAAFELANLAPPAFSSFEDLGMLELLFSASVADKYGQESPEDFFSVAVSREQSAKMNWQWFRETIFLGTFDPTAFSKFGLSFKESDSTQGISDVLAAIRKEYEQGMAEYGMPDPTGKMWTAASQLANWSNCARFPYSELRE